MLRCARAAQKNGQEFRCRSVCGDEHIQAPSCERDFFEFGNTLESVRFRQLERRNSRNRKT